MSDLMYTRAESHEHLLMLLRQGNAIPPQPLHNQAADRIEALAARVAKLEEALRPFAGIAPGFLEWHRGPSLIQEQWPDHKPILSRTWPDTENKDMVNDRKIYRSDFTRAAFALQEERK